MTGDDAILGERTPRAIPFYVVKSAVENAKPQDEYVVVRSDNDYSYARTLDAANTLADDLRSEIETLSPIPHTVQVVELQETAPEADNPGEDQ